jgi:hypothetical protein
MEADMLCGELRANGIECVHRSAGFVAGTFGSSVASAAFGEAVQTEILVEEKDLEAAKKLLPAG